MFEFLRFIGESIKEGWEQGRAELEEENRLRHQDIELFSSKPPTLENVAVALSCPMRAMLTTGSSLRLFQMNVMGEKEISGLEKLLYRDFGINDEYSLREVLVKYRLSIKTCNDSAKKIYYSSLCLYMITSGVDIGFIYFSDFRDETLRAVSDIVSMRKINSWESFANHFLEGDTLNNALGKKLLRKQVDHLLEDFDSPWSVWEWNKLSGVL